LILISSCRSIGLLPLLHAGVRLGVQFSKSADLEKPTERGTHVRVGSKCEILATSRYFLLMARDQTLAVRRTPCAGNGRRATLQAVDLYGLCRKRPQRGGLCSASAALRASQKRTRHFAAGPSLGRNRQRGRLAHALYAATHTGGIRANTGFALRPQCR
jgi:hypothetical protein